MPNPIAFITGITGQDGSYLAEHLLGKGYTVHGLVRLSAFQDPVYGLRHLQEALDGPLGVNLHLHPGDMCDPLSLAQLLKVVRPDEVYNLAAQSHVHRSFELPDYTAQVNALGTLRLIEALRASGLVKEVRFYQASTSELYGDTAAAVLREDSPFAPCSPYAVAKLHAFWTVVTARQMGLFGCNGILFNHESPRRAPAFVTRKITRAAGALSLGLRSAPLRLGALDTQRDWGFAPEYVRSMWLMLQQPTPADFVIATGQGHTVREFATQAFASAGRPVRWEGVGGEERAVCQSTQEILITVDPALFRPTEPRRLVGDAARAQSGLGWRPQTGLSALVALMVAHDLEALKHPNMKPSYG